MGKCRHTKCRWSLGGEGQCETADCNEKWKYLDMSMEIKKKNTVKIKISSNMTQIKINKKNTYSKLRETKDTKITDYLSVPISSF